MRQYAESMGFLFFFSFTDELQRNGPGAPGGYLRWRQAPPRTTPAKRNRWPSWDVLGRLGTNGPLWPTCNDGDLARGLSDLSFATANGVANWNMQGPTTCPKTMPSETATGTGLGDLVPRIIASNGFPSGPQLLP